MEWLQGFEDLLNNIAYAIEYAKVFVLVVLICFVILFLVLAVQAKRIKHLNTTLENFIKENDYNLDYLTKLMEKQLRIKNQEGEKGDVEHT